MLECAGARYEWNNEWKKEVAVRIQNLHKSREIDAHPCSSRLGTTNIVRFHKAHSLTPFSSFETRLVRGIQPQIPGTPRKWSKFASPTFLLAPPRLDTRIAEGSVSIYCAARNLPKRGSQPLIYIPAQALAETIR